MSRVLAIDGRPTDSSLLGRFVFLFCSMLALLGPGVTRIAHAEAPRRLMILRGAAPEVDVELRDTIDQLLLESVSGRPSFSSVDVSPVPFEDVELAAGCSSRDADCLQRIAATLDADWLMVRELARERDGNTYLTLIAHDGPTARITRRAVAEVSEHPRSAPSRVVPLLVDRLYPTPASLETQAPQAAPGGPAPALPPLSVAPRDRKIPMLTWVGAPLVGTGAVALTTGIALLARSRSDAREYDELRIRRMGDVDRAVELHDRAQSRAAIGRGLIIGGTLAAVGGAVALLWTPLIQRREPRTLGWDLAPTRAGMGVVVGGSWRGGL